MRERLDEIKARCDAYAAYLERQMRVLPSMPERWLDTGEEVRLLLEERGLLLSEIERLSGEVRRLEGERDAEREALVNFWLRTTSLRQQEEKLHCIYCATRDYPQVPHDKDCPVTMARNAQAALILARAAGE